VTPSSTLKTLNRGEYLKALVMAFRLSNTKLLTRVYRSVPTSDIDLLVRDVPIVYLERLLRFVAQEADASPHLEFNLRWIESLLRQHGRELKARQGEYAEVTRLIQRAITRLQGEIMKVAEQNAHTVEFLLAQPRKVDEQDRVRALTNGTAAGAAEDDESMDEAGDGEGEGDWVGFD